MTRAATECGKNVAGRTANNPGTGRSEGDTPSVTKDKDRR